MVPLPSRVGRNLTATRRCGSTTPANPSDGRSGYSTAPASRKHPGNQHGKTTEERREGESTPQKDKPDAPVEEAGTWRPRPGRTTRGRLGKEALWPAGTLAFGLWHRFVSAQTQNLSLSVLNLLVATHCARNRAILTVSCAWYSCPSGLDHRPVLKISHASVYVPGEHKENAISWWVQA